MKRLAGSLAVLLLSLGASASVHAQDIPDGDDCASHPSGVWFDGGKRGAICVRDNRGHVIFYMGGSLQSQEDPQRDDYTQLCGGVVVFDRTWAGNADWDRVDEDGTVHHCD